MVVALRKDDGRLLRFTTDKRRGEWVGHAPGATAVAVSADGARVFTGQLGKLDSWNLAAGTPGESYNVGDAHIADLATSRDGRWLAAATFEGEVLVWRVGEAKPTAHYRDHTERAVALAFSPDDAWLVSGSWDRTLRVRELDTLEADPEAQRDAIIARYGLPVAEALGRTAAVRPQ
ncbi:MAG: WD40 repeat protein [Myxococcota bacterium]